MMIISLTVFLCVILRSNCLNEDMIETGYIQDPASVGKLPIQFEKDLLESDYFDISEDTEVEHRFENHQNENKRSLDEDLKMLDPFMKQQLKEYCLSKEGKKDMALQKTCTKGQ